MLAAKAASPRQTRTAGSSGESAKRGAVQQLRAAGQDPGAAEGDEADEGDRDRQRQGDLAGVDAAVGGHPDRDREQDQGENVVDDRGPEHGAGGASAGDAEVEEGGRGDAGAGRRQGGAEEDAGFGAFAEDEAAADAGEEGEDDAGAADRDRDPAHRFHLGEPRLEADPEEEEDDAELGEDAQHLADLDPAEDRGADEDAAEDLADDRRLADPLEQLVAELGREQDEEEVGEDRGGVGTGGEGKVHGSRRRLCGGQEEFALR